MIKWIEVVIFLSLQVTLLSNSFFYRRNNKSHWKLTHTNTHSWYICLLN